MKRGTHVSSVRRSEVHQQGHVTEAAIRITLLGLITCTETIQDLRLYHDLKNTQFHHSLLREIKEFGSRMKCRGR